MIYCSDMAWVDPTTRLPTRHSTMTLTWRMLRRYRGSLFISRTNIADFRFNVV